MGESPLKEVVGGVGSGSVSLPLEGKLFTSSGIS